jgi:hypothetical protein
MEEIWKDIPEYEGLYQVSNLGRVKRITTNKILKLYKRGFSYLGASLSKNGIRKTMYIHQLVSMAFLGHKSNKWELVVDHINNNPTDNRLENLQIVTQRFNVYRNRDGCSSKYKGIHWDKYAKKWKAQIQISGKKKYLGLFDCELKAHQAYENALKNLESMQPF